MKARTYLAGFFGAVLIAAAVNNWPAGATLLRTVKEGDAPPKWLEPSYDPLDFLKSKSVQGLSREEAYSIALYWAVGTSDADPVSVQGLYPMNGDSIGITNQWLPFPDGHGSYASTNLLFYVNGVLVGTNSLPLTTTASSTVAPIARVEFYDIFTTNGVTTTNLITVVTNTSPIPRNVIVY